MVKIVSQFVLYCFTLYFTTVTVGTQAAVLAGLDITMFIEFNPPANEEWVRAFVLVELSWLG